MSGSVGVVACGLACPLGLRARPALAALGAGLDRFAESNLVRDIAGDAARRSALAMLDPKMSRTERVLFLATHAVTEVFEHVSAEPASVLPCYLALPEAEQGGALDVWRVARAISDAARAGASGIGLDVAGERLFTSGRAAAFFAVKAALEALRRGACSMALVGGLDSRVDPLTLRALADKNHLLGQANPDGLLPGEAAAFVLLAKDGASLAPKLALVSASAVAESTRESSQRDSLDVAESLTAVFAALRSQRTGRVDALISAQTGQSRFGRSLSYAYLRNSELMPEPLRLTTLGARLGDTGAASGAVALVAGVLGSHPGSVPSLMPKRHDTALVFAESDDGAAGACIIEGSAR